jgi:hypothetical protein
MANTAIFVDYFVCFFGQPMMFWHEIGDGTIGIVEFDGFASQSVELI